MIGKRVLFFNRPVVWIVAVVFVLSQMATVVSGYTVKGPEGNSITVTDTEVSGTLDGVTGTVDEESMSLSADGDSITVTDDDIEVDGDGGGGGGGNGAAIAVGVAVVVIAAVAGYFWYSHHKASKTAEITTPDKVTLCQVNDSVSLVVEPMALSNFDSDRNSLEDMEAKDFASAKIGLIFDF